MRSTTAASTTPTTARRTARLVAVLGALPVAAALALGGGSAIAEESNVLGPQAPASDVQGPLAPVSSANTGTVTTYSPTTGQLAGQGGKTRTYDAGYLGVPADRKQPKGQRLTEADAAAQSSGMGYAGRKGNINGGNNGYECGGNNGIGQGNPAHSGCAGALIVD